MAHIGRNTFDRIAKTTLYTERANRSRPFPRGRGAVSPAFSSLIVMLSGDIPAIADNTTPGGPVDGTVYRYDQNDNLTETKRKVKVYNFLKQDFSSDTFVGVSQYSGRWSPTVWDCPD